MYTSINIRISKHIILQDVEYIKFVPVFRLIKFEYVPSNVSQCLHLEEIVLLKIWITSLKIHCISNRKWKIYCKLVSATNVRISALINVVIVIAFKTVRRYPKWLALAANNLLIKKLSIVFDPRPAICLFCIHSLTTLSKLGLLLQSSIFESSKGSKPTPQALLDSKMTTAFRKCCFSCERFGMHQWQVLVKIFQ